MRKSLELRVRVVVVACGWIAISLMVAEPVLCAAQQQQSSQQGDGQQSAGDNQNAARAESSGKTKPVQTSSGIPNPSRSEACI